MNYQVESIGAFDRAARRLARKYRYLLYIEAKPEKGDVTLEEIEALLAELAEDA